MFPRWHVESVEHHATDPACGRLLNAFDLVRIHRFGELDEDADNMDEKLSPGTDNRKNFGYAAILKIYHELGLGVFLKNKSRHENFEYNTNSIMIMLVISRLLSPGSKKKAFEEKDQYFERFNFSLADVYRSLSHFSKIATEFQRYLNSQINEKYGRNTKTIYYDVTNFYFETDEAVYWKHVRYMCHLRITLMPTF